jgi:serine/threonine protein kinase
MAVDPDRLEKLRISASKLPLTERASFLDRECGGDAELRDRVEALLRKHDTVASAAHDPHQTGRFTPDPDDATDVDRSAGQVGAVIVGRYTLMQILGEGGMGEVWAARQSEPVKRDVALKLIKAGMDTRAVLQRFDAERQALALMDHPNIAKVFDGGMTPDRRPFFVMELVNGLPLTRFCDEARLGVRQRLELFVAVCQAVQHAHQKGIIHRDLKPSNILVTAIDGRPVPKVIDFGVAKAVGGRLTDDSPSTQFGIVVGTFEYMSPEQAGYTGADVDTRSDIYSLGVILYELLTGLRPIDAKRLRKAALAEMIRMIQVEEPSKPSTRLSTDEATPSLAALRDIEPRRLMALLRGDLDWVVMKCLEKQRERRYETANGLARDVQRFLADEPVEARPPSAAYRFTKFLRRHKAPVAAAAVILLAVLGGIVGTSIGMTRARAAEKLANERLVDVEAERDAKEAARKDAVIERDAKEAARKTAATISDFYVGMFQSPDPYKDGRTITVAETLDKATKKLENDRDTPPEERIRLMHALAGTYRALSLPRQALPLDEKVRDYFLTTVGPENRDSLNAMEVLARSYFDTGRREDALKLREEILPLRRKVAGPEHPQTKVAMNNLAASYLDAGRRDDAIKMQSDALALYRKVNGPEHPLTLTAINNLAQMYSLSGQRDAATKLQEEMLAIRRKVLGPEHLDTLAGMFNLAGNYAAAGRVEEALKMEEEVLSGFRKKFGPEHSDTLTVMAGVATLYDTLLRRDDALKMREEVLALRRKTSGPEHPYTLWAMNNLAASYLNTNRRDEAMKLQEEVLALRRKVSGPEHPDTLTAMANLAFSYSEAGRRDEGLKLREEALPLSRKMNGPEHPETLNIIAGLVASYREVGKFEQAASLLEAALPVARKKLPHDNIVVAVMLCEAGLAKLHDKAFAEAEPPFREALGILQKLIPDSLATLVTRSDLAAALLGQKKYAEAETLLLASYAGMKNREKTIPAGRRYRLPEVLDRLIELYTATNKPDEVTKWRQERGKYRDGGPQAAGNK